MRFSLRITIFLALSALIVISSSTIIIISVIMGRNSIDNVLASLVRNVSASVTEKTIDFLKPASMVAKTEDVLYDLSFEQKSGVNMNEYSGITRKIADHFDTKYLTQYGLTREKLRGMIIGKMVKMKSFVDWSREMCTLYYQISKIHVTDYGTCDFAMIKKMDDGSISVTYRMQFYSPRVKDNILVTVWDHKNLDYYKENYVHPETGRKIDYSNKISLSRSSYDPRKRPWFKIAVDEFEEAKKEGRRNNPTWTPAYVFYSDETPGLTCSFALGKKAIEHIYCIDIGIIDISTKYLANLHIGKNGKAFIINETGEIIAYNPYTRISDDPARQQQIVKEELSKLITQIPRYEDTNDKQKITGYDFRLTSIMNSPNELYREAFIQSGLKQDPDKKSPEGDTAEIKLNELKQFRFGFKGTSYLGSFSPFPAGSGFRWAVGIVIPENDFMDIIKKNSLIILIVSLVTLAMSFIIGLLISNSITHELKALTDETEKIKGFSLDNPVRIDSRLVEIHQMGESFYNMEIGLRSFSKYVPSDIVRFLIQSGKEAELGGENRVLSVSFSDIADFTTISESLSPNRLVTDLGDYLSEMSSIVLTNGGTIDKYIGDAIMAFWNAPMDCSDHAYQACKSAIESHARLEQLRSTRWKEEQRPLFKARFGINTGELVVGNMGSDRRMNYTVLGDAVNLASRLEGINKMYNTCIICSEFTYDLVKDRIACRILDVVRVKGKTKPVAIYEVIGFRDDIPAAMEQYALEYAEGLENYMHRRFNDALKIFTQLQAQRPGDTPSKLLKDRCQRYLINPPGSGWDGVFDRREK